MNKNILIFDFDGVLVDSKDLIFEATNYALAFLNLTTISKKEFFSKSKIQLLEERSISKFKIILLLIIARKYIFKHRKEIILNTALIHSLSKSQKELYILSSNSPRVIKYCLKDYPSLFRKIIGNAGLNDKHKTLKKFQSNGVYFTDEVRDIIECKKVEIESIGVSWGIDSKEQLLKAGAYKVLENFKEIELYI